LKAACTVSTKKPVYASLKQYFGSQFLSCDPTLF
jgi:hypothetical protein